MRFFVMKIEEWLRSLFKLYIFIKIMLMLDNAVQWENIFCSS